MDEGMVLGQNSLDRRLGVPERHGPLLVGFDVVGTSAGAACQLLVQSLHGLRSL